LGIDESLWQLANPNLLFEEGQRVNLALFDYATECPWIYGASLGGTMGEGREPQIILKSDQRNRVLNLGLAENSKLNQAARTRTENSSKAMFLKLR
jgi:hypothetical protein